MFGRSARGSAVPPDGEGVPGWRDASLVDTANQNVGVGADADLPPEVRFRTGITRLIRNYLSRHGNMAEAPALFLLNPAGPEREDDAGYVRRPTIDDGLEPIESHIWFVSESVGSGLGLRMPAWNN